MDAISNLPWVVNSRGDDDGELVERICAAAGVRPDIAHKVDSLELILDFVAADLGIAPTYAATRPGRQNWPPSALLTQRVPARVACERLTSGADHAPASDGQAAADNPEGTSSA